MLNVCRFCVRWTDSASDVDQLASLEIVKHLFGLEIECCPGFPRQVCDECCLLLESCCRFRDQLLETEKSLQRLQATGTLGSLLDREEIGIVGHSVSPTEDETTAYYLSEENDDLKPSICDNAEDESDINELEKQHQVLPREELVDIQIEAVEELEIVSAPSEDAAVDVIPNELTTPDNDDEDTDAQSIKDQSVQSEPSMEDVESEENSHDRSVTTEEKPRRTRNARKTRHTKPTKTQASEASKPQAWDTSKKKLLIEKDDRIPNKCYICDTVSPSAAELESHLDEHKDLLPYRCQQCSTSEHPVEIRTILALNNHLETHTYKFVCDQCPLRYRRYTSWYEHNSRVHSVPGSYTCDLCGLHFEEHRKFLKHMNGHRNKQLQRYKCGTCDKVFQTSTLLKRHELIHAGDAPFKCPHCARGFNHEWNFKLHQRRHSQPSKVYKCDRCGIQYANFLDWRRHMKEHFPADPRYWEVTDMLSESLRDPAGYPKWCSEPGCAYMAASLQLMWAHYRTHFKAFQCEFCPQKYPHASKLQRHIDLVHRGLRPYVCGKCDKSFGYRHKLLEHLNVHDGVRNLKCRYCEKRFSHTSNLTVHERVHTGAKPYLCDLCGARFRTSSAFGKHRGQQDRATGLRMPSKSCVKQQRKHQQQREVQVTAGTDNNERGQELQDDGDEPT